jgi:hypothetical protein
VPTYPATYIPEQGAESAGTSYRNTTVPTKKRNPSSDNALAHHVVNVRDGSICNRAPDTNQINVQSLESGVHEGFAASML